MFAIADTDAPKRRLRTYFMNLAEIEIPVAVMLVLRSGLRSDVRGRNYVAYTKISKLNFGCSVIFHIAPHFLIPSVFCVKYVISILIRAYAIVVEGLCESRKLGLIIFGIIRAANVADI